MCCGFTARCRYTRQAQANREWLRTADRAARGAARRVSGSRPDGEGAGAGAEIARVSGVGLGAQPATDGEIPIFHGPDQFERFMNQTDIAVCLLPLTRETEGILCARTFAMMPKGAMVINIGRGGHVVEADLIAALDSGTALLRRARRAAARAAAAGKPAMAAPESDRDAACRAPADRAAARHRDRRQYKQRRGRRRALAGNRQSS